jgi:hypothetical protein
MAGSTRSLMKMKYGGTTLPDSDEAPALYGRGLSAFPGNVTDCQVVPLPLAGSSLTPMNPSGDHHDPEARVLCLVHVPIM